ERHAWHTCAALRTLLLPFSARLAKQYTQSSQRGTGVPRMPFSDDNRPQAGAAAARTTGFSTIGRLITAESTTSSLTSQQAASKDPVRSNSTPPSHTPRKPPT